MVARHLWAQGHRRAGIVATQNALRGLRCQRSDQWPYDVLTRTQGFVNEWEQLGGTWRPLQSHVKDGTTWLEQGEFLEVFGDRDQAPTAVFGFRDVEAVRVQQGIKEWTPQLKHKVDIVGYFDTPWSRAAHPPLSTVCLRLEQIAEHTARLVDAALTDGEVKNPVRVVQPELIVR
jgi:DNA-binding LacI/PurR family transcriptional regulator